MKLLRSCAKAIIIRDERILSIKYADEGGEYYALPGGGSCTARRFQRLFCANAKKSLASRS